MRFFARSAPNVTVNGELLSSKGPPGCATRIRPDVASGGTSATIFVPAGLNFGLLAATPLNVTTCPGANPEPVMVTFVPTGPLDGLNPAMTGTATVPENAAGAGMNTVRATAATSAHRLICRRGASVLSDRRWVDRRIGSLLMQDSGLARSRVQRPMDAHT